MNDKKEIFENAPPWKAVLTFAVPTILSQLITVIYNLADIFWIGRTNDPNQVAALTLAFPVFMILTVIGNLLGMGANSLIARALGARELEKAKKASCFAFWGSLALTLAWMAVLGLFLDPIVRFVGASEATIGFTRQYLIYVVLLGGLPTMVGFQLSHLLRAVGETKKAGFGMMLGGVLNIFLDPVFIFLLKMDVPGAALATCLSNCVSAVYLFLALRRARSGAIDLNPKRFRWEGPLVKEIVLVGAPSAVIVFLSAFGNMVMTHCASTYSDVAIAAFGVTQKGGLIAAHIMVGTTQGVMPLIGYNYAARAFPRTKRIIRWEGILLMSLVTLTLILLQLFPRQYMRIFINDEETIRLGVTFTHIWSISILGMCLTNLYSTVFQAIGKWKHSMALNVGRQGVLLIPIMLLMNHFGGLIGLVSAQPVSDTLAAVLATLLYVHERKKIFPRPGAGREAEGEAE